MQGKQVSRLKACLCLTLLYLSWGGSFLGMKFTLTGFPPSLRTVYACVAQGFSCSCCFLS